MKQPSKRLLGALALAAGAVGAAGALLRKRRKMGASQQQAKNPLNVWARPGMVVTFRAELMPGRDREQRTARIKELLPSGRVLLHEVEGEHAQNEFERIG